MTKPEDWWEMLAGFDVVINGAGALQDGAGDDLLAVHAAGVAALSTACALAGVQRLVQLSAPGAVADAPTAFLRTKARGDAAVRECGVHWAILKPGLVVGPQASGGTALVRGLAGLPGIQPLAHHDSLVQTVSLQELSEEVADCAAGLRPCGFEADLVETAAHELASVVTAFRAWLGLSPARVIPMPRWSAVLAGALGDAASMLGWRTPWRATAMRSMAAGVTGDPGAWRAVRGRDAWSLAETLSRLPATRQERSFARLYFLHPLVLLTLAAFWVGSGVIGLVEREAAAGILVTAGFLLESALTLVLAGAVADIGLGLLVLCRRTSRVALYGMVAVTVGYPGAATLYVPHLWIDPLGSLVKSIPAAVLAMLALALQHDA